jgi:hypothetical protein
MKVEATISSYQTSTTQSSEAKVTKPLSGKSITEQYLKEYMQTTLTFSQTNIEVQNDPFGGLTLKDIGYTGKPIADLTQEEAKELVSEDGFFGVSKTSERIADFVISGAGDDLEKLKAGREGMLQGFKEAEKMWGEKLPDISYETIQKALEKVDARIAELGGQVLDISS